MMMCPRLALAVQNICSVKILKLISKYVERNVGICQKLRRSIPKSVAMATVKTS